jgi:hypothetical protein
MSTKIFGSELYGRLNDGLNSGHHSRGDSIKLIRDELLSIAHGETDTVATGHAYGFMTIPLARFVDSDGTTCGVVLHGWCVEPSSMISDVHMHSFDMSAQSLLRSVNHQPAYVGFVPHGKKPPED